MSGSKDENVSAAQQRLNKILEEEKKQEREKQLQEIMRKQKQELREKLGADSDDSDFDSDGDAAGKPAKTGAKKTTTDTQGGKSKHKMSQGYNYFMSKAGKDVEESSEVEFTEESQQQSIAKATKH